MPIVSIERVPVRNLGLGWFGFDHLQLTFQLSDVNNAAPQEQWYVLEGVRDGGNFSFRLGVQGDDGITTLSMANGRRTGDALAAVIGTPEDRGSRELATGVAGFDAWQIMARHGSEIEEQALPYFAIGLAGITPTLNSSSVIASLLHVAGFDVQSSLPANLRSSPGTNTFIGDTRNNSIEMTNGFNALVGGGGNDTLSSGAEPGVVEKFYGGQHKDTIVWSTGLNYIHGGLPGTDYETDGLDTIDYFDVGLVIIHAFPFAIQHKAPQYVATHSGGQDWIYSIERVEWNEDSDSIITTGQLRVFRESFLLDLGEEEVSGRGDVASFSDLNDDLLINASGNDLMMVQSENAATDATAYWLQSPEWIEGSMGADRIYGGPALRGVDGGAGDDIVDGRLATAFAAGSPLGHDIELYGGSGSDIIVSGEGRSYAEGGDGADTFVLSTITTAADMVEFVIADADASDRLFVPYDFFADVPGDFEGSALLPLLGAIAQIPGEASFADLPENEGPWATGPLSRSDFFSFEWQLQNDFWTGSDETDGIIDFAGAVYYNREGADLLIHVFQGFGFEITEPGFDDEPWTHIFNAVMTNTETVIRVKDFSEGDLGIRFYDPGTPSFVEVETDHGLFSGFDYPNYDEAVRALTNGGELGAPLELRPAEIAYVPPDGGSGTSTAKSVRGGPGNDTLAGSARDDLLSGGAGNDQMRGGAGNDVYIVDSAGDVVIEELRAGIDTIRASVNYTLPDNVEDLELSGGARRGTGNNLDNTIAGTSGSDLLSGLGGSDGLLGGAGNDTLIGGAGSDVYYYEPGEGYDIVRDLGSASDRDILILNGIRPADITFLRPADDPDDLILAFAGGGHILLDEFGSVAGAGVDSVLLESTTSWSRATLAAGAASAPIVDNEAPTAVDDQDLGMRAGSTIIPYSLLLANDSDFESGQLSVNAVQSLSSGVSAALTPEGVRISTGLSYSGNASFRYTLSDGEGGTDTARVDLTVLANRAPTVNERIADASVTAGQVYNLRLPATLFSDADSDSLVVSAALKNGAPLPPWLTFNAATGVLSGRAPAASTGTLDIVLTASDGSAGVSTGYRLTITPANRAPVAAADTGFTIDAGEALAIAPASLLANDRDADGDRLTITSVGNASHGSVTLSRDGRVVFTAEDDYSGAASFRYTVSDGKGATATAQVTLRVVDEPALNTITGTRKANVLIGTAGADRIEGRGGNDILIGLGGNDECTVIGSGNGLDMFLGGAGRDVIRGGSGSDVIGVRDAKAGLFSIERIDGGAGRDVLHFTGRQDIIDLSRIEIAGVELIDAGGGNDRITGSASRDVMKGGAGADVFIFAPGSGPDVILDFATGTLRARVVDAVDLRAFEFDSFADVMEHAAERDGSTVLDLGGGDSVRLAGVRIADLKADDFLI